MKELYILLLFQTCCLADVEAGNYEIDDSLILQTVVVTGTRTPKLLGNSPITTRVITAEDIRKTDVTHIGELLQQVLPGLELSYSMNQQVSLNMQGFGGNSVLFLQDGERMAGETLDNVDYYRLNLDNVDRIEIVKGAASSLYGSNAVGGVINIISKKSTKPWSLNLNVRRSAYSNQRYGGTARFNSGKINNTVNIQHTSIDDIHLKHDGDYDRIFGNRTWNLKERMIYTPTCHLSITARAGYYFRERNMQIADKDRYRDFCGGVKTNYSLGTKNNMEVAYSYDQYDKSNYITKSHYDIRDYSNVQHCCRSLFSHCFAVDNTLTLGGDFIRDYLMSFQFTNNGSKTQQSYDVFVQQDLALTNKLSLIGGLRYDYYSRTRSGRFSAKAGAMYRYGYSTFRASYSGGFRAPTLKEMYMNYNMANIFVIYGNENLKSETSHNFSVSADYRRGRYNLDISGLYNIVSNRITTVWNRTLNGMKYVNMTDMDIFGLNAEASAKYICGLSARLSYAYIYEHIFNGKPSLTATRPHTATAQIGYDKRWKRYGISVALNGRYLSSVMADEYTSASSYQSTVKVHYSGYTLWKLSFMQHILKGVDITFAVDNIFNYVPSYYYNNSPSTRGAVLSAGLSMDIDELFR